MWIRRNPNPARQHVEDCVIRAICIATGRYWLDVYDELCAVGREVYNMPSSNSVWGLYLYRLGFEPFLLPEACPSCVTVREFTRRFPIGIYIIGTGSHAIAVRDGDYYDTWDSGDEIPIYYFRKESQNE